MDLGIIFGVLGTWALIIWSILAGGDLMSFVNVPSIIIVIGATFTVTFMAFPTGNVKKIISSGKKAFFPEKRSFDKLIEDLVSFAEIARRDGILSLENSVKDVDDEFIVSGIQMAVDGTDPELIEQILDSELDNLVDRHETNKAIWDAVGKYAPAFGMIGTLIGLVIMLMNMDDPSKIGPGMAVAILTTLYGAVIANAIAIPIADRLAIRSSEEVIYKTIIIKGVMSIQSGDNPRIVEQKLRTFLPPSMRPAGDEEAA